jgi:hypothetical protein
MKFKFTIFFFFAFAITAFPQDKATITQTIRGQIIDKNNATNLIGATVALIGNLEQKSTVTNENGTFRFEDITIGRYQLKVSYIGYQTVLLKEILVESGKEIVKTIALPIGTNLNEIEIVAGRQEINNLGTQTITVEQTQRYAATFYDPARLANSFAGIVNNNDQANHLVVRGNSPNTTVWRLEGVEIVNPNHTANAGTVTDNPTQNGGGVNILSSQLLGDSYFMKGNYPTQYGNALGGILDMRLRNGNNEKREYTAQIGLIGIDLAAEGPIEKSKSSYLINYRYSTLGLLNQLGVELGDEAINFQDLSFNLYFPTEKFGIFTVFGMGGKSSNVFKTQRDTSLWAIDKDKQDIDFQSEMGALGFTHLLPISKHGIWKTAFVASTVRSTRTANSLNFNNEEFKINPFQSAIAEEAKNSINSAIDIKLLKKLRLKTGIVATALTQNYRFAVFHKIDSTEILVNTSGSNWLLRPFTDLQFDIDPKLQMNLGLGYSYYSMNKTDAIEPRFSINYQLNKNQNLSFAYRLQSQLQSPLVYHSSSIFPNDLLGQNNASTYNRTLEMTKAHQFALNYNFNLNKNWSAQTEIYYQLLFDVPIINHQNSTFSALNVFDDVVQDTLANLGTGQNYGLEITIQKLMSNDYYLLFTQSFYESKYIGGDGIVRDTRFNGNFATAITAGKEYSWQSKKGKKRLIGFNSKILLLGGLRTQTIDIEQSKIQNTTIYYNTFAFEKQFDNFFKIDFRFYYKQNHKKYTSTLALDILNLTNQKNPSFEYFDTSQQQIITRYQLGIIPILVYRVEF